MFEDIVDINKNYDETFDPTVDTQLSSDIFDQQTSNNVISFNCLVSFLAKVSSEIKKFLNILLYLNLFNSLGNVNTTSNYCFYCQRFQRIISVIILVYRACIYKYTSLVM